jgi:hypothetical protein
LRESEARFRTMAEGAPVMIWMSGRDGRCTYFNRPWLEFTGRSLAQESGNGWRENVHAEDLQRCEDMFNESFDAGREFRMEFRLRRRDGQYRWILDHGVPRFTPEHEFLGYIGSCIDITERKEAEDVLQQARAELEQRVLERTKELTWANTALRGEKAFSDSLIELAPAMVAVVDAQGNLIRTNAHAEQLTGYFFAETQGRNMIEMFVPTEEKPRIRHLLQEAIDGRAAQELVVPIRTRDGSIRQIEWSSKPIMNAAGEPSAVLAIGHDITERQQAQEALALSEAMFRGFVESTTDGIVVVNQQGRILLVNSQAEHLFGYGPKELFKQPLARLVPERFRNGDAHDFQKFFAAPRSRPLGNGLELSALRKDGSEFPVEITLSPVSTKKGLLVFSAIRDITTRKQAEEALRESEARFRQLAEAIEQVFWMITVDRKQVVYISPAYERIWGRTCQSLYNSPRSWLEAVHPEDRGQVSKVVSKQRAPERYDLEYRIRRPDGTERWIRDRGFPVQDASGKVQRVAGIADDVTERRRMEEELRRSEHHLSNFFNLAPIGLAWLSPGGTILRANQAQLDLLGYTAEEYVGYNFLEFGTDSASGQELLEWLAQKEIVRNLRMTQRRKDGTMRHVLVDANALWSDNQFQYSSIFLRDVTDRVNLEKEILHISEREHRRIAQDLHDGLGQLLVGAAYVAGALRQDLAAKAPADARKAGRIVEVLSEAVWQTRDLSRGLHPVEAESTGLMSALESLAARTRKLFNVHCRFSCRRPVLIEDNIVATHLFRIAQEAVTNAIKHGKPGHIEICLSKTTERIMLGVRDDGSGIPARKRKHAGMGLRIMRYRAGMVGGSLAVQKEATGGTTVACTVHLGGDDGRPHRPKPGLKKKRSNEE